MLEYKDDKLGIIKVLNVTEARSHFASMLGDRNSRYIITKNNKPLRAIIDYAEYEYLKNTFGDQLPQRQQAAGIEYPSHTEEDGATEQEKKNKKSKSRVPGILESHIALSHSTPDKRHRTQIAVEQGLPPQPEEDYFSSTSADEASEQELILPAEDSSMETLVPPAVDADTKWTEQTGMKTQPQTQRAPVEKAAPKVAEPKKETKKQDKEEEEYFRKYRKLYETLGVNAATQHGAESQETEPGTEAATDIENELEPSSQTEEFLVEASPEPSEKPYRNEKTIPVEESQRQGKPQTRGGRSTQETSEELPSLKDLLASLEQEKLTGEDEEVDESQIEDLIQRITED